MYKTKYNDYFGENIQLFTATDFIARFYRTIKSSSSQYTFHLNINILYVIMASIPAEVEVRPQKMAASISSAGEPDQKKNQRKNPKKIPLKLYLKRSLNRPGPD
ncbi:hypothetical protein ES705_39589 [subsurface metagenome]